MIVKDKDMQCILEALREVIVSDYLHLTPEEFKSSEKILIHFGNKKMKVDELMDVLADFWVPCSVSQNFKNYRKQLEYYLHRYNIQDLPVDLNHIFIASVMRKP